MYIMLWASGPITLLVSHTYASYIRHWCIFSHKEIQTNLPVFLTWYQSHYSNLFLAILSLLAWLLFFSTSLPPSQPPLQPFAVEPPTSSSRRPWVPNLQQPLLRSFTLHRPLPLALLSQTLLRLQFWSYHRDRLALIYKTVKDSTSLETAHAPTRR